MDPSLQPYWVHGCKLCTRLLTLSYLHVRNYMSKDEPLPLIVADDEIYEDDEAGLFVSLRTIGIIVLVSTWAIFLISVNSFFEIWRFIIAPLKYYSETKDLYMYLKNGFLIVDYYVVSLWCLYVVFWWWALLSWIGLKLFRQSKGLQT